MLDLRNAYNLDHIREGDEWKTAVNTPGETLVFQALFNDVLREMVDLFIYVYLDDI